MKTRLILWMTTKVLIVGTSIVLAEDTTTITPTSEAAEGLDLQAVCELFKDSENLNSFEKSLNDPESGINNLDLDENGEVDFIRVVEEVNNDVHLIILQASLGEDDFQDVATIEVEQSEDDYSMQVHGNEVIYGSDYYMAPSHMQIKTWPIITFIYKPGYSPYRSRYYYGYYPRGWKPFAPVPHDRYRTKIVVYTKRAGFKYTKAGRARIVTKVNYKPKSSVLVKRKVVRVPSGTKVMTTTKKTRKKPSHP